MCESKWAQPDEDASVLMTTEESRSGEQTHLSIDSNTANENRENEKMKSH
jgi:hypothetical protein